MRTQPLPGLLPGAGRCEVQTTVMKRHQGRRSALPLLLFALLPALLAGLFLAVPAAVAGDDPDTSADSPDRPELPGALPQLSEGDVLFVMDAVASPSGNGLARVEVYLRVSNDQLFFMKRTPGLGDSLDLELRFLTTGGELLRKWNRRSLVFASDSASAASASTRQILLLPVNVEPGEYVLEARMDDVQAIKKTLLGMIRKERRSGTARGLLRVRPMDPDSLEISDLEFAEHWSPRDSSVFRKRRVTVYPNPGRRYGRDGSDVMVYFEGHLPAGVPAAELRLAWEVLDRRGTRLRLLADTLDAPHDFDRAQTLRVGGLPAGSYRLRLTVRIEGGPSRMVESTFDMTWASASGLDRSIVALVDEASLALTDSELDDFEQMSPGEQERFWNEYWNKPRSEPGFEDFNALSEFEHRIQAANSVYGGNERGMFTDRGRMLVRYGLPDEVRQQVMPGNGSTLTDIGGNIPLEQDSRKGDVLRQPGGRAVGDTRAYEIWDYDIKARLIFGTKRHGARLGSRMRFVFVDETGVGNYRLKYSSE